MITLKTLDAEQIRVRAAEFVGIASDQPGEYWTLEHFLLDLPEKWGLSFAAWDGGTPVAYTMLSRRDIDRVHLHHFMVAAPYRGKGLGARMVAEMMSRTAASGARHLTLKAQLDNAPARAFYAHHGFHERGMENGFLALYKSIKPRAVP
jgi:GNAT superfamily N-acetyltransferase